MNTAILKKCIVELAKDTPDLSYIRGMLETIVEMQEPVVSTGYFEEVMPNISQPSPKWPEPRIVTTDTPEGMAVEAALASLNVSKPSNNLTIEKNVILN